MTSVVKSARKDLETFQSEFAIYQTRFQEEDGRKLPQDVIDSLATQFDLTSIAQNLEAGVISGVKASKRIQFVIGSYLYMMNRVNLFVLTKGKPASLRAWYDLRVEEGVLEPDIEISEEDGSKVDRAYSSLTKYVRVAKKWIYELGYSIEELGTARNVGVLDASARIVTPVNKDVWLADARKENSEKRAGKKANAALKIHTQQHVPFDNITPQMTEDYLAQHEEKDEPETPKYPAMPVPKTWGISAKSFTPTSIIIRQGNITIKGKVNE